MLGTHVRVSFLVIHVVHGVVIIMPECKVVLSKDSEEHTPQSYKEKPLWSGHQNFNRLLYLNKWRSPFIN